MNTLIMEQEYYHLKDKEVTIITKKQNITLEIDGIVKINDLESQEDLNLKTPSTAAVERLCPRRRASGCFSTVSTPPTSNTSIYLITTTFREGHGYAIQMRSVKADRKPADRHPGAAQPHAEPGARRHSHRNRHERRHTDLLR